MKLIFVYNANSGFLNSIINSSHEFLSPNTCQCDLCSLTHGNFKENKLWTNFSVSVKTDLGFYHKDEF